VGVIVLKEILNILAKKNSVKLLKILPYETQNFFTGKMPPLP